MLLTPTSDKAFSRGLLDVFIRAGLTAALVIFCFEIFRPFFDLVVWSLILATTIYPLQVGLRRRLGDRHGRAAALIVVLALGVVMAPTYLLGNAVVNSVENAVTAVRNGDLYVPPPAEAVAAWPLVGKRVYELWMNAATDLTGLLQRFSPQIRGFSLVVLGKLAGLGMSVLVFVAALIVAGVVMAHGEEGKKSALKIASRIFGPDRGARITGLCTTTIRAVALGVVGIAFIQMMLIGAGFIVMGIPAAGLLTLAVLLLGIMQLPATIVTLPVIGFVLYTQGASVASIVFAIYVFVAGLVDNVLKPLLLGRGVDVPMPVVLIGALGGMISGGVIGLFIGPVALAVGYRLFWLWVEDPAGEAANARGQRQPSVRAEGR
ncbi:AI-2E family transporter [Caballeronia telluris]|uniref:Membrane protein n=1 Tax=Caballeronia telluris TaxID=326475 RepID=A0A158KE47_9BURK|nr:AI-2E family transporter [Caballeronia telluris]SAL79334.1 membrane protein [Caballeronia telluris]